MWVGVGGYGSVMCVWCDVWGREYFQFPQVRDVLLTVNGSMKCKKGACTVWQSSSLSLRAGSDKEEEGRSVLGVREGESQGARRRD